MNRFQAAAWAAVVVGVIAVGGASAQAPIQPINSYKPIDFQYTPSPINSPWGGQPGESLDDYQRRMRDSVDSWDRAQNQKTDEKLEKEMPWWKSVSEFKAPSGDQWTTVGAILLFALMAGIFLWVGVSSTRRRPPAS